MSGPEPRITRHAMERYAGWLGGPLSRATPEAVERSFRLWLSRAFVADPIPRRRARALIDHGNTARYLMHEDHIAVLVPDGNSREVVVTFHANTRGWYMKRKATP